MKRRFHCGAVVTAPSLGEMPIEYKERFILAPSQRQPNWWVLTDKEHLVVIRFEAHNFNERQKVSILDESILQSDSITPSEASKMVARIMREMGDYMSYRHEIAL